MGDFSRFTSLNDDIARNRNGIVMAQTAAPGSQTGAMQSQDLRSTQNMYGGTTRLKEMAGQDMPYTPTSLNKSLKKLKRPKKWHPKKNRLKRYTANKKRGKKKNVGHSN